MSVRLFELNAFTTASEWADGTMLSLNGEGVVQKGDAYGGMDTATLKAFATVVLQKAGNGVATFPPSGCKQGRSILEQRTDT